MILYYLLYVFLYLLSLLPFKVLYFISDCLYPILYYAIRYRRDVIESNLKIAFPEKTEVERKEIIKDFYKRFLDNFIETIKLLTISERQLRRRFVCDYSTVEDIFHTGRKLQIHTAHFFNWEFADAAFSLQLPYHLLVVYMPIKSKPIDKIFFKMRSRFGATLIPATSFSTEILKYGRELTALALVADQNPGNPEQAFWTKFFGKMTPVVVGPEKGARINNAAVVMVSFNRVKRGYYKADIKLLTTEPRTLPRGEITTQLMQFVEETIREHPSNYLWSHRRWKWQFEAKYEKRIV